MKPDCQIIHGDCREVLRTLPEKSVHCTICSPPYWGLRKYEGVEPSVWGGHWLSCRLSDAPIWQDDGTCLGCRDCIGPNRDYTGAWHGLLGLEPTIDLYVQHIVECFREVKRVLRDDGTLLLNCGDSYAGSGANNRATCEWTTGGSPAPTDKTVERDLKQQTGLAPKNLIGQPWRIAFALQADGWYLRSDIIWHKPNPMPESVTDRPTRAHEYLFLLTKRKTYYYDAEAVREKVQIGNTPIGRDNAAGYKDATSCREDGKLTRYGKAWCNPAGRNKRSVWRIPTEANPESHFASFPRKLVLPCVLAGTSEKGCCPECGTPWVRLVEKSGGTIGRSWHDHKADTEKGMGQYDPTCQKGGVGKAQNEDGQAYSSKTLGWRPGCGCVGVIGRDSPAAMGEIEKLPLAACTVLDPFVGSGQAGIVATQQGRRFIGIDASAEYCEMARRRIANPEPERETPDVEGQMMFEELEV